MVQSVLSVVVVLLTLAVEAVAVTKDLELDTEVAAQVVC
jgi:hypothetical protein